jgi:hypothetical protein
MPFLFSLIPTTFLVVVGYFLIYTSTRVAGGLKRFGQYLGVWVFFLAGVIFLGGLLASTGVVHTPMGAMMLHMERMESMEKQQLEVLRELERE